MPAPDLRLNPIRDTQFSSEEGVHKNKQTNKYDIVFNNFRSILEQCLEMIDVFWIGSAAAGRFQHQKRGAVSKREHFWNNCIFFLIVRTLENSAPSVIFKKLTERTKLLSFFKRRWTSLWSKTVMRTPCAHQFLLLSGQKLGNITLLSMNHV